MNNEDIKIIVNSFFELRKENEILRNKYQIEKSKKEKKQDILNELEEPINVLINFAVCCSPSLNCDEHCSYYDDEKQECGKLEEEFELAQNAKKLREIFKRKENKNETI